jgi:two-component system chemotaxis response regulator CheY
LNKLGLAINQLDLWLSLPKKANFDKDQVMIKILVVDDVQPMFLQRFRKEIRNNEVEFAFALSGFAALDYLARHHQETHLILSDINMPGMSGLELLTKIRHTYEAPPPMVMMITAYGDNENYQHAMRNGANDFLTKPVDFMLLKEKVNAFGGSASQN